MKVATFKALLSRSNSALASYIIPLRSSGSSPLARRGRSLGMAILMSASGGMHG